MEKLKALRPDAFLRLLFAFFTLAFLVAAVFMPDRAGMLTGMRNIIVQPMKSATNCFDSGGFAGAFLNTGLVSLICTLLYCLPKAKPNAGSVIAFLLTVGFGFWGINILNFWFGILGVLIYCLAMRKPVGTQVNTMLFSTALCPLYSELLLRYFMPSDFGFSWAGLALAAAVGIAVGFFLTAGLAYSANVHKGFDLYSAAVPMGMAAFFLRALLYGVLGGDLGKAKVLTDLKVASAPVCNIFCGVLFVFFIVIALLMGCRPKEYLELMKDSGYKADFAAKYGTAAMLMNAGVFGLMILLYYNLIGATFNAVTLGCVFCMLATFCSGSHPRNIWPIMAGYVLTSLLCGALFTGFNGGEYAQAVNAQAIVIGVCFAGGLSPLAGKYGWQYGIIAAGMHFCLVTSVPLMHGGFLFYNGGFTAAFICLLFVPVLEHFCKTKEERAVSRPASR